jgi:hypothetical protein
MTMIRKSVMFLVMLLGASFMTSSMAGDDMPVFPEYQFAPNNDVHQQ